MQKTGHQPTRYPAAVLVLLAETTSRFATIDWVIVVAYLAVVILIGFLAARKRLAAKSGDDFFLAGKSMPMWAVAISILATAQSAATFVGAPQEAYAGNLTYLATNIGPILAAIVVATLFIPAFYRHGVTSVYELIGHEMGSGAQRMASLMFMLGRVLASGARLFIVAIPFSLVAFGDIEPPHLVLSIVIVAAVATAYSMAGGIRAVIWTDVIQVIVYLTCICLALALIWQKIPLDAAGIIELLRTHDESSPDAEDKLLLIDASFNISNPYTIWSSLIGITLLMIAAYGADQDLTQRMLTCRSSRAASGSVILATVIGLPVVFIFLVMGLLLWVFYTQPEVMGAAAPQYNVSDSRRVFIDFILNEMHAGVRGLMMAGLFAAAMSSMDSGLNAMSSTTVADFYRPWRAKRTPNPPIGDRTERRMARLASLFWACMISGFACLCIWWQAASGDTLIRFALGVMTYAYSGLLGVFFTALLTNRGNAASAVGAMIAGIIVVGMTDPLVWSHIASLIQTDVQPAFTWRLVLGTIASVSVCLMGDRPKR